MTSGYTQFHGIEKNLILRAFLKFDGVRFRAKIVKFKIIRGFFVDFFGGEFSGFYRGSRRLVLLRGGTDARMYSMFARPCCDRGGGRSPVY